MQVRPFPIRQLFLGRDFFHSDEKLREHYDYIFVDTPPVGTIIDAAIVAQKCDGAVLVVESEAVSHKVAKKVLVQIEKSGCRTLGAVLNKVDMKKTSIILVIVESMPPIMKK